MKLKFFAFSFALFSLVACPLTAKEADGQKHFEPTAETPMQFRMAGSGGNCLLCQWIAAEGTIDPGTTERFLRFLARTQAGESGLFVHLNSPGGNVLEALEFGRTIRREKLNTVVSQTIGEERRSDDPKFDRYIVEYHDRPDDTKPSCLSACAFVFAGGNLRYAEGNYQEPKYLGFGVVGRLGVHQFYSPKTLKAPDQAVFSAADRMIDQEIIAEISTYLETMDIAPSLISLMARTPPYEMHMLNEEELRLTKLVNNRVYEAQLKGYSNGVAVVEVRYQTNDGNFKVELFCRKGKIAMLVQPEWNIPPNWDDATAWGYYKKMILDGPDIPVKLITSPKTAESKEPIEKLLFEFDSGNLSEVTSLKNFRFSQEPGFGSRYSAYALASLGFELPDSFDGLHVLPSTCQ